MTPKFTTVLTSVLLALAAISVRAERLPVKIYTSADGLGSSFVDFLMRDSRGFLWFCTRDGLSRFDGTRFVTYRVGGKDAPPGIESITETRGGVYWVTTTGGLYRFTADTLSRATDTDTGRPLLNAEYISSERGPIFEDHEGTLWYAGDDLFRMISKNGKVELEPTHLNLPKTTNRPLLLFQIREAPDGCLWLNSNYGLIRRLPDGRVVLYQHETNVRLGLASLAIEPTGRVWVVWRNDFFVINPTPLAVAQTAQHPFTVKPLAPTLTTATIPDRAITLPSKPDEVLQITESAINPLTVRVHRTEDGHVWLSADDRLIEFDGLMFHSYTSAQGLPGGMAQMAEDTAGNLWIGARAGLARLDRKGLTSYYEADGLNSASIFDIAEGADGTLYVANGNFFLSRYTNHHFETVHPHIASDAHSLWTSRFAVLTRANEWWILTSDKLYRFAANDLHHPLATYDSHHGLQANEAFQLFEDSHGDIWLSQQPSEDENLGLYRLKKGEKEFYRFTAAENFPAGKAASSFAEDNNGNCWFAFYEGGLARYANGRFTFFGQKEGVPPGNTSDLLVDSRGRLWIGSVRGGVSRIDNPNSEKLQFVSFTTDNGLSSNNVRTLVEDHYGNIYVGTVRGVDRIARDTNRIRHYSVSDGLAGDFVVDSHCDKSGALWFATTNGLSRLWPSDNEEHEPPAVWLSDLRIAGEEQPLSTLGNAEINIGELGHTRNNFQIEFFGLDFHTNESIHYQFRLDGADANWSVPTEQRTVTYANLKPGSYRFMVRALNADNVAGGAPAILVFKILPPLWLRSWFIALVTLAVLAVLSALYRYRVAHLRQVNAALAEAKHAEENLSRSRQERLTELESVRTRIATDLHDDIGASLTQISILSEVARQGLKGNGASAGPLQSIANVSNELVDTMSDIVWAINPLKDHLQDLVQRMRRFASDVLSAKGIAFTFDAPILTKEIALGANPRREVFLIFKETLTNIVKHSEASEVEIELAFSETLLTLNIRDNGRGVAAERLAAGPSLYAGEKGGNGIYSMKRRAHEVNGRFEIVSPASGGTRVTFELPLHHMHASNGDRNGKSDTR